jgi:hypothetical protein
LRAQTSARITLFMNSETKAADRSIQEICAIVDANRANRRGSYDGLLSHDIGNYSRHLMFGDNDEAFPTQAEWSRIVD